MATYVHIVQDADIDSIHAQAPNSPMLVDPEEFDEKHDVAIIGPQQLETDDVEPEAEAELEAEPRADDCGFFQTSI